MCNEFKNDIELNNEIRKWEKDPITSRIINIFENDVAKVYYTKQHTKGEDGAYRLQDVLSIDLKGARTVILHSPRLDPYVSVKDNIVCMTSDGECWVCDIATGKDNSIDMPIVAFDHYVDFSVDQNRDIENTFVISGRGCYWGCEAYPQEFEIYIDKDTLEEKKQDVWDEEEGYEAYRQSLEDDEQC